MTVWKEYRSCCCRGRGYRNASKGVAYSSKCIAGRDFQGLCYVTVSGECTCYSALTISWQRLNRRAVAAFLAFSALYQESGKLQLPEVLLRLTIYIQDPVDRRRQPNSPATQNTNTTTRHERREALETGDVQNARHLHRWPFWPPPRPLTSLQINMVVIFLLWRAYNRGEC